MLAFLVAAAAAAQLAANGGAAAARTLAHPGRDPNLLHRHLAEIAARELDQEQALRGLLGQGGPPEEQAEVLARLAGLLRARALALSIQGQADIVAAGAAEAKAMRERAATVRAEAIARYRELLQRFPASPRQDEALFFLADTLQDAGREEEAVAAARSLVARFPRSNYAPDSHVFIGEHLFEKARIEEALREYRAAAEVTFAEVYPYALYKMAWCRFNQGAFPDAMKLLHQVVEVSLGRAKASLGSESAGKVQLAREARRDYVVAYARAGRPESARDEFARLFGAADGLHMLELYGKLLFDTGRDLEAQLVHRQLLELHQMSAGAMLDQTRLLLLSSRSGKLRDVIREAQGLVDVFRKVRAQPHAHGLSEAEEEANRTAEQTLRELAVRQHNAAKKTGLEDVFASARALYADYLALFPDAPEAYDLRFFDAELLYGLGEKQEAAALYEEVVRHDLAAARRGVAPGRWQDKAAWGAVLARDESVREQQERSEAHGRKLQNDHKARPPSSGAPAQRPLSAREEMLARACALYLEALPRGPHAVEVAFKLGRLRYLSGAFDEARERLSALALAHPESELAEYAANLVLDIENLRHDPAAVRSWAQRFLADKRLASRGTLSRDLARVEEESAYAIADATADDGAKAAALLAFAQTHSRGRLVDRALFGAAAALSRAGKIDEALEVRARLVRDQPQSGLLPRALLASAADRAQVGDFGESATLLERYAAGYRRQADAKRRRGARGKREGASEALYDEARARTALHDAAVLREARGELQKALQDRNLALAGWKGSADRDETVLAAAQLEVRLGHPARAGRLLVSLARDASAKPSLAIVALRDAARAFTLARDSTNAAFTWQQVERTYRALPARAREKAGIEAAVAAAEAHLALGAHDFEAYRRQRIEPPLLRTLARKVSLLQAVKKRAEEVVALRQAEPAVCALAQLGEAQLLLADGIARSPVPGGLSGDARTLYRAQIAEKAQPLYAEAKETLQGAVGRARELGVGGACAFRLQTLLGKLGEEGGARPSLPELARSDRGAVPALLEGASDADGGGASERARRLLGEALQSAKAGSADDAIARFRAAAEAAPRWPVARFDLAAQLDRAGQAEEAEKQYRAVLAIPGAPAKLMEAAAERGAALTLARGDGAAARSIVAALEKVAPGSTAAKAAAAEVELALGNVRAAEGAARAALARSAKSVRALLALAAVQLAAGTQGTARLLALRAADAAPRDARPRLFLAEVARSARDAAAELAALREAVGADPESSAAALQIGRALWERGLLQEATAQLEQSTKLDPRDPAAHLALGAALAAQGRGQRASEELGESARLSPRAPEPHLELARLKLDGEQDAKSAFSEAQAFLRLSPAVPPAGHPVYSLLQRCEQALKGHAQASVVQETSSGDK